MIAPGDKIGVGVSGGKDSLALLVFLAELRKYHSNPFTLEAITIDLGLGMDYSGIAKLCEKLDVPFTLVKTQIAPVIFDYRKEKNPCSMCSKMRRGALNQALLDKGFNKLALGHHYDDAVETFVMNLMLEGRLYCFSPVTDMSIPDEGISETAAAAQQNRAITVIRPLVYAREWEIRKVAEMSELPVVKMACPNDGVSSRQWSKEWLEEQEKQNPGVRQRIFGAMTRSHLCNW
jgi:tRNA(Ile)-lysidine synthase TilS/MesJ